MTLAGVEKTQPQPCMQVSIVLEYSNKLYQCNPRIGEQKHSGQISQQLLWHRRHYNYRIVIF